MTPARQFWRRHAVLPGVAFGIALGLILAFDLDRIITHAVFFDARSNQWLGGAGGAWWARDVIHTGGRWVARLAAAAALLVWCAGFRNQRLRPWRRHAGFAFLALALSTAFVGGLKQVTNVDCPWDLSEFGGDRPHVPLFADRPDALPRAQCFPGAHAASGFALMCGYFLWRDRSRRRARWALAVGILTGLVFSFGQEARGAHFISHDLTSAALVWFVQLALYVWLLAPAELRNRSTPLGRSAPGALSALD